VWQLALVITISVLGVSLVLGLIYLIWRWRTCDMVRMDEHSPYDETFDRRTISTTLDWFILRHLQDQRCMPARQRFLDADREHNDLLNRYALHQLRKQHITLQPIASTLTEAVRPPDAAHYLPRYFPDQELDSALVMLKHELIAERLLATISYLKRITNSRAESLRSFAELRGGHIPFVPDAYVTFYNDLVGEADDFDREPGIREKMRLLAVRMIFPARRQEFDYWQERRLQTYQIPIPVARDAVEGWFYLKPEDVPTAG
jgi:hypothetical protein